MTKMLHPGDSMPAFRLMSDTADEISTEALLGKRYVIFIYPKDDTFG